MGMQKSVPLMIWSDCAGNRRAARLELGSVDGFLRRCRGAAVCRRLNLEICREKPKATTGIEPV
jgi:hypothetical protein